MSARELQGDLEYLRDLEYQEETGFLEADFGEDETYVEVSMRESSQVISWETDSDFRELLDATRQSYPIKYRILGVTGPGRDHIDKPCVKIRPEDIYDPVLENESDQDRWSDYRHLQMDFDDFSVVWDNFRDEQKQVRLFLDGAGAGPFNRIFPRVEEREEITGDIDEFFLENTYNPV